MYSSTVNDRNCSRTPVDIDVTLVTARNLPFQARLTNISFNGGYIQTDNQALQLNTPLTVVLQKQEGDIQQIYRMSASVVRRDSNGAGILFDDFDTDTVRSLRTIYRSALAYFN